jgi:predicted kinase
VTTPPTLWITVGLPGAGKTTRAKAIAREEGAVLLSPDGWIAPLWGTLRIGTTRDVFEGLMVTTALQALSVGTDVVLDFGLWARDERTALRAMAADVGAECRVVYLPLASRDEQDARLHARDGGQFEMSAAELDAAFEFFQIPSADELGAGPLDAPPGGFNAWSEWAADRWPGLAMPTRSSNTPRS